MKAGRPPSGVQRLNDWIRRRHGGVPIRSIKACGMSDALSYLIRSQLVRVTPSGLARPVRLQPTKE